MAKLTFSCPICLVKTFEKSHFNLGNKRFITLNCNHTITEDKIKSSTISEIHLNDGRTLFPFQVEGVKFLEQSNFKALITDEMGLGKTIQAVGAASIHFEELKPFLVIVKASLTYQWLKEFCSGTGKLKAQILDSKTDPIPGFDIYISSYDSLPAREKKGGKGQTEGLIPKIQKLGIKTMILDEVQMIKNHSSNRTNAVREIARAERVMPKPSAVAINKPRIEMIASDLLKYHGLNKNFKLQFSDLGNKILGMTECKASKDGIIVGTIYINAHHATHSNESEVIETILHEIAHAITPGAGHKPIWMDTSKAIGGTGEAVSYCQGTVDPELRKEATIKHIIALSGTPIKNNASEYFPILNLLRPEIFYNHDRFIYNWVDSYWDGRTNRLGGINPHRLEEFQELTKEFIIRRTRSEVLPDLPKIQRDYKFYPMGQEVMKAYNKKVKALSDFMDENDSSSSNIKIQGELIGYLQVLRHITGLAKIEPTIEYISEYIEAANGQSKITVFHHHKDVGEILFRKLEELYPEQVIRMTANDDSSARMDKIEEFRNHKSILIAPTLACGEGINLQFCSHAVLMEREWNPANEEQAEGRFSRIGSEASSILVNYPTATGTIDEFFAELVEQKRAAITQTLDGKTIDWNESSILRELADIVVKKWRMN